jgi:hypothetical protein
MTSLASRRGIAALLLAGMGVVFVALGAIEFIASRGRPPLGYVGWDGVVVPIVASAVLALVGGAAVVAAWRLITSGKARRFGLWWTAIMAVLVGLVLGGGIVQWIATPGQNRLPGAVLVTGLIFAGLVLTFVALLSIRDVAGKSPSERPQP